MTKKLNTTPDEVVEAFSKQLQDYFSPVDAGVAINALSTALSTLPTYDERDDDSIQYAEIINLIKPPTP